MPTPVVTNAKIKLQPQRRRMAKLALELLRDRIPASDAKKAARGKPFVSIFDYTDTVFQGKLQDVIDRLDSVVYPTS